MAPCERLAWSVLLRALKDCQAGQEIDTDDLAAWGAIVRLEPDQVARTMQRVSAGGVGREGGQGDVRLNEMPALVVSRGPLPSLLPFGLPLPG